MHLIQESNAQAATARRALSAIVPLSLQQQSRWDAGQWIQTHNIGFAYRLMGELQIPLFRRALEIVCSRHEAMLTRIIVVDGVPSQLVEPPPRDLLQELQICTHETSPAVQQAIHQGKAFFEQPFDETAGLLFRCGLLCLGDRDHVLVLAMNHMIADGFSLRILLNELGLCYDDLKLNRKSSLRQRPLQYGEYALMQRQGQASWQDAHGSYWQTRLVNARRVQLPKDNDIIGISLYSAEEIRIELGGATSVGLRQLARLRKTTLARVVLALYTAWLSMLSGSRDFVVPFTSVGRHLPELGTIGFFAHVIYLRMAIGEDDTFLDVLDTTNVELTTASAHLDFGQTASLRPEFHAGTRFQWESNAGDAQIMHDSVAQRASTSRLSACPFQLASGIPKNSMCAIDVLLRFMDGPLGIVGCGTYRADLFKASTIAHFSGAMRALAAQVLRDPACRISDMEHCCLERS